MWTQDVLTHEYKVTRKINTKKKKQKLNESNLNRKKNNNKNNYKYFAI